MVKVITFRAVAKVVFTGIVILFNGFIKKVTGFFYLIS